MGGALNQLSQNITDALNPGTAEARDAEYKRRVKEEQYNSAPAQLQRAQVEQAKQFRGQLGGYQQSIAGSLRQQASGNLAEQQKQTKSNLSQRGLLYGGIGEGAQARNKIASEVGLGNAITTSNKELENQASRMENESISNAMAIQSAQQQAQNQMYSQALTQMNSTNSQVGGAMGLIGSLYGTGGNMSGLAKGLIGSK